MGVSSSTLGQVHTSNIASRKLSSNTNDPKLAEIHKLVLKNYPYLEDVAESMLITDNRLPDCPIIYANDDFEAMTLYSKEEVIGRNCRFLQGDYTNKGAVLAIRQAVHYGTQVEAQILNYRKDGMPFWNNMLLLPVYKGKSCYYFIAIQKEVVPLHLATPPAEWLPPQVSIYFDRQNLPLAARRFAEGDVTGQRLLEITTQDQLKKLGIHVFRSRVLQHIAKLRIINDGRTPTVATSTTTTKKSSSKKSKSKKTSSVKTIETIQAGSETRNASFSPFGDDFVATEQENTTKYSMDGINTNINVNHPSNINYWRGENNLINRACKVYYQGKISLFLLNIEHITLGALETKIVDTVKRLRSPPNSIGVINKPFVPADADLLAAEKAKKIKKTAKSKYARRNSITSYRPNVPRMVLLTSDEQLRTYINEYSGTLRVWVEDDKARMLGMKVSIDSRFGNGNGVADGSSEHPLLGSSSSKSNSNTINTCNGGESTSSFLSATYTDSGGPTPTPYNGSQYTFETVQGWEPEDVAEWCTAIGLPEVGELFVEHDVDGYSLFELLLSDLEEMGVEDPLLRSRILREIIQFEETLAVKSYEPQYITPPPGAEEQMGKLVQLHNPMNMFHYDISGAGSDV